MCRNCAPLIKSSDEDDSNLQELEAQSRSGKVADGDGGTLKNRMLKSYYRRSKAAKAKTMEIMAEKDI